MDEAPKYRGLIGTIAFHVMILVLMLLITLKTTRQPDDLGGITINFGTEEDGSGLTEPEEQEPAAPSAVAQRTQPVRERAKEPAPNLMTQDKEEAPTITKQTNPVDEAELKRQQELARQRELELERQRQEEAERLKQQQQQAQLNAMRDRMQRTLGGQAAEGGTQGEGTGTVTGNQGSISGSTESTNRGEGGRGEGVSFSLSGRSVIGSLVKPEYRVNDYGTVVVRITVDRDGVVTAAEAGVRGTTTTDTRLINAARDAAFKTRFNRIENPGVQQGTITYHFKLN